ncbi:short chain dehydrogenase [Colletotrichum cuscutae]|uniref:Short chain dehydrogenase n=1 Tax=Colletotrichum cuscutae TaxID=1209917 RepID=A0AAI9UL73_9PEZI|nr:short chain dehydrogenase [Colletotrichum cuscutae]
MPLYKPPNPGAPVLSQFSLKGKVATVTGGARGIGLEIVRGLAEAGADVALIYATSKDAVEIASQIAKDTGVNIRAYQSDVRSRASIAATVDQIVQDFGYLDVMIANSGVCADIPSLEYTEDTWKDNNSVNLDGVMWTAQAAGKVFKQQGRGNLIITASVSATLVNIPQRQAAYNSSKAAAVHLAKSLAVEWVDFARVNSVSPGFIETEMDGDIPGKRMAETSELKGVYVFLASDACCYMTGADIIVDGGYTLT